MAKEVSKVLWRNTKEHVKDQIQIPFQTEKVYWLNFSPFETHLYECVREQFRERLSLGFKDSYSSKNYKGILDYNPNLRLDQLDRSFINNLLAPILNLRITCNHPQLILRKSDFMSHATDEETDKLLSMEKSLELLAKKTKSESESLFRSLSTNLNTLAGIRMLQKKVIYLKIILSKTSTYNNNFSIVVSRYRTQWRNYSSEIWGHFNFKMPL